MTSNKLNKSKYQIPLIRINPVTLLLYSIVSTIAVPLAISQQLSGFGYLGAFNIGLGITAISCLLLTIIWQIFSIFAPKFSYFQHQLFMVLIFLGVGVFRGLLFYYSIEAVNYQQPSSLSLRIVNSSISAAYWLTIISIAHEETRLFKARYKEVLQTAIYRKARDINSVKRDFKELDSKLEDIQTVLARNISTLIRDHVDKESLLQASKIVRDTIEKSIRPLSHRLWIESSTFFPKTKPLGAIKAAISKPSIDPLQISLLISLGMSLNIISSFGLLRGIFGTVSIFITIFVYFYLFSFSENPQKSFNLSKNISFLLAPGAILAIYFSILNDVLFDDDARVINLILIPYCFVVALLLSIYQLNRKDRINLLASLEKELELMVSDSNLKHSFMTSHMASYVHNSLQSELLAISMQIEEIAKNPDEFEAKQALERIGARINRSISLDFEDFLENPIDRIGKLQSAWRGLVDLNIEIPNDCLESENRNFLIAQIIEEGITNAVRHGQAKVVRISAAKLKDQSVLLEIDSDSKAKEQGVAGIGSEWLDRFVPGNWSREFLADRVIWKIRFSE